MKKHLFIIITCIGILECACVTNPPVCHPVQEYDVRYHPRARQLSRFHPYAYHTPAARYREIVIYKSRLSRSQERRLAYASSQSPPYRNASMENKRFYPANSSYALSDEYRHNRIENSLENLHRRLSFLEGKVNKNAIEIQELSNIREEITELNRLIRESLKNESRRR